MITNLPLTGVAGQPYTHNMIYSDGISFIRDGRMNLLHSPVYANVLTFPAVNVGAFYQNENGNKSTVGFL